ncbi:S-adenosylhomocysteine/5'-methylthioadenosine nucleosidase [Thermotomaculum hydrothermale]|uniref:Futalosine hydrolase n=1 Tax=Thermotomaculum hydrothermale TaxID=981385 RepID=A0A7R6PVS1_9BACT|nr:futalosine hydrolase [Thermotomaculum hydrothermale]BBB33537.1 S-adenosylhomocysteine/5'-methylthioadenosine nucleosidase [Thermotomaculum hydrothermale]
MKKDKLIVVATPLEAEFVVQGFKCDFEKVKVASGVAFFPKSDEKHAVLTTGIGKTNSAIVLTHFFNNFFIPEEVINTGICGAYPGEGISIGHIAVAESEIYGDEGVEADRFYTLEDIAFPSLIKKDETYFNEFKIPHSKSVRLKLLKKTKLSVYGGKFITVSTTTSNPELEIKRKELFNPLCESMEGAAVCHTCYAFDVKFTEIRGVSNFVGSYAKEGWQIERAMQLTAGSVYAYIEE